ncbi:MAG: citramalate synthase [Candidatus Moranbacteria bacterium]|nr:citramalate synthase [Candidatus Moranbacteria bacterium]
MARVEIYDTTLRDGIQAENFNLSVDDRIRITKKLDSFGVDFIEGGWPGANPSAVEYFQKMRDVQLKHAQLAAFGSTRQFKNYPDKDPNLAALLAAQTPVITIFGKTWDFHVIHALQINPRDNLRIIFDSLAYLGQFEKRLIYDAEHFFDGFKANPEYALATLGKAIDGGAETLVLCDTNGGTLPHEMVLIIQQVQEFIKKKGSSVKLGIHAHNDSETAVANSLLAVSLGVTQVQGTINGFGERCGNANLVSILPSLVLKMGCECKSGDNLDQLHETSRLVNELANIPHNRYQPYVGESAFAHKGGVHVSAVQRNPLTYEHIDPERVGNVRRILISDQAGRSNVLHKAEKYGLDLKSDNPVVATIIKQLKEMENQGYQYEGAEASFELLMRRAMGWGHEFFQLKSLRTMDHKYRMDRDPLSEATIRVCTKSGGEVHTASMGDGPVNALDKALRKALTKFYPSLKEVELIDFKVRVLSGEHGTGARVRVLIESKDAHSSWGTVGVSHNVIEAAWQALVDSFVYKLMKDEMKKA